jgi:hypothetical protein
MTSHCIHRAFRAAVAVVLACGFAVEARAEGPIGTTGGPEIAFRGCIAYQHENFAGAKFTIRGNYNLSYTGSRWNDIISSIACNTSCSMTVFEHRDFAGARHVFHPNILYVGDAWNDRISSAKVRCS